LIRDRVVAVTDEGVTGLPVWPALPLRCSVAPLRPGWSGGECGWWACRGGPQLFPARRPGPAPRQVQDESSAGGRDPAGDVDGPGPQCGPAGGTHRGSDGGRAGDVERDHRVRDPGCVGRVLSGR